MPLITTRASVAYGAGFGKVLGGGGAVDTGAMIPIRSYIVPSGGAATITFSSIPQTYKHLQLRINARSSENVTGQANFTMNFNSDTTHTNYRSHWMRGTGSATQSGDLQSSSYYIYTGTITCSGTGQNSMFGTTIVDILEYTNTNKYKTVKSMGGADLNNTDGLINFVSGVWFSTSAVTGFTFSLPGGGVFQPYSQFALYGIKGA